MHTKMDSRSILVLFGTVCVLLFMPETVVAKTKPTKAPPPPISDSCLGCLCLGLTDCDSSVKCEKQVCGLFSITKAYWSDAGKPTVNNGTSNAKDAYRNCANDALCATQTIQLYTQKYGQDCNDDGKIDCMDYAMIHFNGGFSCKKKLPSDFAKIFNECYILFSSGL